MAGELTSNTKVCRRKDLLARPLDDDLVMADLETGNYYGLADTGRAIWNLIDEPIPVRAICDTLGSRYAVDPQLVEREVMGFLEQLRQHNLITVSS
jgi:Coenzyme PQQ synthesis protein D (PqqD)